MSDFNGENFNLLHGDCLTRMKDMADNSVDLTVTSPPYNMNLRIRNKVYCSRQIVKEFSTKYDGFDDNKPMDEYFEFNKCVITELLRVSKLVFFNVQILTGNKPALFKIIGEFADNIKELIVWDKVNSQPAVSSKVLNSRFELIIVFEKQSPESRMFESAVFERGTLENLWQIKRGRKIDKSHGAVFPSELVETIIMNFSKEGDTIFDPFMGTNQTGVVSLQNNREFIGIELIDKYFDISCERIREHW